MRRLYSRIYVHFLGVLLVVGLATGLVFAVGQRGAFRREVAERVARHAASLVGEGFPERTEVARRVRQLHDDLDVDVTAWDLAGRIVAASGAEPRPLTSGESVELRARGVVASSRPGWMVAAAIRDPVSGMVVGLVEVSAAPRLRAPPPWRPVAGAALVLAIVAVAAAPLARRISLPVERLTEAARRLGAGDLSARVPEGEAASGRGRGGHAGRRPRIAELEALTRAFNDMAERVERLVADQKTLLANVSHELRSPLARIRVALALLPREGEGEARLAAVETDLAELDGLIEAVLTTARLEAGGLPLAVGPVDVRRLLEEIAARSRHDRLTAGLDVRVQAGPPVTIEGDGALLRRALWNVVENAAKYGCPPIVLAAEPAGGDDVTLTVSDAGEGIPAAERQRVLDPFYRGDRARTPSAAGEPPRGVGLGLTLARRIAEAHGGRILVGPVSVTDGRERGCQVRLTVPRRAPAAPGSAIV